jgi:hypothetical protein
MTLARLTLPTDEQVEQINKSVRDWNRPVDEVIHMNTLRDAFNNSSTVSETVIRVTNEALTAAKAGEPSKTVTVDPALVPVVFDRLRLLEIQVKVEDRMYGDQNVLTLSGWAKS